MEALRFLFRLRAAPTCRFPLPPNDYLQESSRKGESELKYLCLAYEEERALSGLSRDEWHNLRSETLDYVGELRRNGHLLVAQALQSARTASTVRVRGGRVSVTDGPFAETKEQLGGFFLIEAQDLNEAIRIASKWPSARLGSIEVRPIEETLREEGRYPAES